MITLADLKKRLEGLPVLRSAADAGKRFEVFLGKAKEARHLAEVSLKEAAESQRAIKGDSYKAFAERVRRACKSAATIRERLSRDPAAIKEPEWDRKLEGVCNECRLAHESLSKAWQMTITAKVNEKRPLVEIAGRLNLQPAQAARKALQDLEREHTPPSTTVAADRVRALLEGLTKLLSGMNLEGPFGKFLSDAMTLQGAELKDILNPEVQEGLNEHKAWKTFRVKLP